MPGPFPDCVQMKSSKLWVGWLFSFAAGLFVLIVAIGRTNILTSFIMGDMVFIVVGIVVVVVNWFVENEWKKNSR